MENSIEEDIKYIEDVIALAIVLPIGEVKIQEEEIEAMQHILSDYKRVLKENEKFRNFLEKIIREYIPDYELEQLIDRYKNESFIPRVEVKKILEDSYRQYLNGSSLDFGIFKDNKFN